MNFYRLIRRLFPYITPFLGLVALSKAVDLGIAQGGAFASSLVSFLQTVRPFWLFLAAVFSYCFYIGIRDRNTPLTVLRLDIVLRLDTPNGDQATLTRTQKIRANHEDVTGYHRILWVDPPGRIFKNSINCNIRISNRDLGGQSNLFLGNPDDPSNRWEFIHCFDPIPWLRSATRTETVVQRDSYTRQTEFYVLEMPQQYRHNKISLSVYFHSLKICPLEKCKGLRVHANGAVKVPLTPLEGGVGVRLSHKKPARGERFIIKWEYPT